MWVYRLVLICCRSLVLDGVSVYQVSENGKGAFAIISLSAFGYLIEGLAFFVAGLRLPSLTWLTMAGQWLQLPFAVVALGFQGSGTNMEQTIFEVLMFLFQGSLFGLFVYLLTCRRWKAMRQENQTK